MAKGKYRFGKCACGRRRSLAASMCRDCWQDNQTRQRILAAPDRAVEHFSDSQVLRINRSDLLSFRKLLRASAESIFDGFSTDYGNGPQLANGTPHAIRFQYNQLLRAVARLDTALGSKEKTK